ncbi:MAG: nucleoside triphosphate pyrophosphohydrolase ham1 [Geoglossum simile]|nr:MAG: nucleoside triphosphate pyrophosphohydrolase ham1 [Geoglossum simile]
MAPRQLNFITGNANKLAEVSAILSDVVHLQSQTLDLVEVQGTIEDISLDKCRRAAETVNGPVLVEDTCLCFNALKGLPGPYVKWFLHDIGLEGLNNLLAAYDDKSAQAVCTFAYSEGPGKEPKIFQGTTDGKIVAARGPPRFGKGNPKTSFQCWDPIFEYEGKTYAEMNPAEKNKISHRFKALEKLKSWLQDEIQGT